MGEGEGEEESGRERRKGRKREGEGEREIGRRREREYLPEDNHAIWSTGNKAKCTKVFHRLKKQQQQQQQQKNNVKHNNKRADRYTNTHTSIQTLIAPACNRNSPSRVRTTGNGREPLLRPLRGLSLQWWIAVFNSSHLASYLHEGVQLLECMHALCKMVSSYWLTHCTIIIIT